MDQSSINKPTKDPKVIEKKVEAVISNGVRTRKKSTIQRAADNFVNEDLHEVKNYILLDVLVPAMKKAISDIVVNGIDMLLYGETGRSKKSNASRISYTRYYDDRDRDRSRRRDRDDDGRSRTGYEYDEIIFETRGDAEKVLSAMEDIIDQYEVVSIGDLFDLAHEPCKAYGVNKYGWDDLRRASVVRVRDGYVIKLPKATLIV